MKTNVPINLTDEERDRLANVLDGKVSKRLATRAEVCEAAEAFLRALVEPEAPTPEAPVTPPVQSFKGNPTEIPAKWRDRLQGKSDGYIRGFLAADRQLRAGK
jgi:hypothetical protein